MKASIKSAIYIIRNPYSYCFRIKVPNDIQPIIGKKELRYSLKTGYLGVAKSKARLLAGGIQRLFRHLRQRDVMTELSDTEIRNLVTRWIQKYLDNIEERWLKDDGNESGISHFDNNPTWSH